VVVWPMLPRKHCQYLNEKYADEYLDHLDHIYGWADSHGIHVEALIVDIEPPNCQPGSDLGPNAPPPPDPEASIFDVAKEQLNKKEFKEAIPKFELVIDKLHEHDTVAISTAMDMAAVDLKTGLPVWQDLSGGPSLIIEWDYVSFMNFGSQNTAFLQDLLGGMGINWEVKDTRYLSYLMCKTIVKKWGNRAAVSMGQTLPGEGHGAVWDDPAELGKDAAVCRSAGIVHLGIYDLQGIIERDDPDAWFEAVLNAQPEKPEYSAKAVTVWNLLQTLSLYGELERTF